MKRTVYKPILALLLTLFVGTLQGQDPNSTLAELPQDGNVEYTLMRKHVNKMLYYVRTTNRNYFAVNAVGASSALRAYIPLEYEVADMEVLGDTLYFCGYNNNQNKGFIGLFHISSFVNGYSSYTIHSNFRISGTTPIQYVKDIRRLCVYSHPTTNKPHIVAIGDSNARNCIVEIPNASAYSTTWTYTIGRTEECNEKFTDITVTEDYVVTGGCINNDNTHIALRAYSKNSIFNSSLCHMIYPFYPYGMGDWIDYGYDDFRLTALVQNHIATYSTLRIRTTQTPQTQRDGLLLNVYGIVAMIGSTGYSPVYSISMRKDDTTGKVKVHNLYYDQGENKILGLAHYRGLTPPMTTAEHSLITEINLSTLTGNLFTRYSTQYWFEGAIMDIANSRYFTIGYNALTPQKLVLTTNDYETNGCIANTEVSCDNGYQLAAKEEKLPFSTYSNTTTRVQAQPVEVNQMPIEYDCSIEETPIIP